MKKTTIIILTVVIIFILTGSGAVYYIAEKTILPPAGNYDDREVELKIQNGFTVSQIAGKLHEEGIIKSTDDFIFTAKLFRLSDQLKAGKYRLHAGLSNYSILKVLVKGRVSGERIVIPEGYTSRQIASLLQKKLEVDSLQFITLVNDTSFIRELDFKVSSLEGYLYPNTYEFHWGTNARNVIRKLVSEFRRNVSDSVMQKINKSELTLTEVITLASIIEGEAMLDNERAVISAVYHNRLKKRMLLQADPTIQYIIPDGPRRLLNRDLTIDSPYNTYKYRGLPPGPVNNPGINSILAAIEPAMVPYLYFVAKGDGSHIFSRDLKEHIRAKRKFDQYRREVKRKANAKKRK